MQLAELVGAVGLLQDQFRVRERVSKSRHQARKAADSRHGSETNLERSGLSQGDALCEQGRVVQKLENVPCFGKEALPGRRQLDGSAGSLKQLHVENSLQNLDLPAEGTLR